MADPTSGWSYQWLILPDTSVCNHDQMSRGCALEDLEFLCSANDMLDTLSQNRLHLSKWRLSDLHCVDKPNSPRRSITFLKLLSLGWLCMIMSAFHYNGLSNAKIDVTLYLAAWELKNCKVQKKHDRFLSCRSIMGRNITDDRPGCCPALAISIILDQAGLGEQRIRVWFLDYIKVECWVFNF